MAWCLERLHTQLHPVEHTCRDALALELIVLDERYGWVNNQPKRPFFDIIWLIIIKTFGQMNLFLYLCG